MPTDLEITVTFLAPVPNGEGYRHPYNKKKSWKYRIGKPHTIGIAGNMVKPFRDTFKRPEVIYKNHQEHGECSKDINSANFTVRGFAERNAINSPIQGTAADMIKLAMIKIHDAFIKHGFRSKMLLQVHDELVFDVLKEELEKVKPVILDCMQTALELPHGVPTTAEVGSGENWLAAH